MTINEDLIVRDFIIKLSWPLWYALPLYTQVMSLARAAKVVQRSVIPTLTRGFATKVAIVPKDAPAAVGPYSHGIEAHGMIFVSGQLPIDPKTSQFVSDTDAGQQTAQCLRNMESVLKAADADLTNVVKTTILLADMSDFAKVCSSLLTSICIPLGSPSKFKPICTSNITSLSLQHRTSHCFIILLGE